MDMVLWTCYISEDEHFKFEVSQCFSLLPVKILHFEITSDMVLTSRISCSGFHCTPMAHCSMAAASSRCISEDFHRVLMEARDRAMEASTRIKEAERQRSKKRAEEAKRKRHENKARALEAMKKDKNQPPAKKVKP